MDEDRLESNMPMTAIESMVDNFKIENGFATRTPAIVPKQLMKAINTIRNIAKNFLIQKLRFVTKIIAITAMAQAFVMALYIHVKESPRWSP